MFSAILAATAACSIATAAQASSQPKLTLSISAFKVLYGHKLTLSGRLVGARAGSPIAIEAWNYGASAPTKIATTTTGAHGAWSYRVKPQVETSYQARWATTVSPRLTAGLEPAVSIRELGNGHVWTRVDAGRSLNRRLVKLQRLTKNGSWQTVAQKRLSKASIAVFSTKLPTSSVRVAMSVNQAGVGFLGTASHALGYRAYALTLSAPSLRVLYGHRLVISGRLLNGRAGRRIAIEKWPYGQSAPTPMGYVVTGANGVWSTTVKPEIETSYQAHWAKTTASARVTIGVQPALSLSELGDGNVLAHVSTGRSLEHHLLKLQQRMSSGRWQTIVQKPLNVTSSVIFDLSLGSSPIRLALSVNQAGLGYLGSTSHALAYHAL